MTATIERQNARRRAEAVIFDLDGVLTDTAELHYQSWQMLARELGIPFDRQKNDALRGLSREQSLELLLANRGPSFNADQKADLTRRKNDDYLRRVQQMSPRDILPGVSELLESLAKMALPAAVASSSRNARVVIERIGLAALFSKVVDGNDAPRSKPDPQVFLLAAERLGVAPRVCVAVEDAASGIEAALAAGMRVVGVGPRERVARAHQVVPALTEITVEALIDV